MRLLALTCVFLGGCLVATPQQTPGVPTDPCVSLGGYAGQGNCFFTVDITTVSLEVPLYRQGDGKKGGAYQLCFSFKDYGGGVGGPATVETTIVSTSTTSYSTPSWGGCRWVSSDTQVTMKIVIPAAPPSKDGIVGKPPTLRVGVQADPSLGAEFFWRAWQTLPSRQFTAWTLLPLAPPPTGPGK